MTTTSKSSSKLSKPIMSNPDAERPTGHSDVAVLWRATTAVAILFSALITAAWFLASGHLESQEIPLFVLSIAGAGVALLMTNKLGSWFGRGALDAATLVLAASLSVVLVVAREIDKRGQGPQFAPKAVLLGGALAAVAYALTLVVTRKRITRPVDWSAATFAILLGGMSYAFVPISGPNASNWGLSLAMVVAGVGAWLGVRGRSPRLLRLVEVVGLVVLSLYVFNIDVPELGAIHHQSFYLGPVNDVLHGRVMLVDTFCQYGVGMVYAVAAFFSVVPLGWGTFKLLMVLLMIAQFLLVHWIVRRATNSPWVGLATATLCAIANVALAIDLPNTGPLRFGPGLVMVAVLTLHAGRPSTRWTRHLPLAVLALCSLWSFEAFVHGSAALLAVRSFHAVADRERVRVLARRFAAAIAWVVAAHALFAVITRIAGGAWPDWGHYLAFVGLYTVDGFVTIKVAPWSIGVVAGAVLVGSFAGLLTMGTLPIRRRGTLPDRRWTTTVAGLTGLGVATFPYFLGRSFPANINLVVIPVIALGGLWIWYLARETAGRTRLTFAALACLAAAMTIGYNDHAMKFTWRHSLLGVSLGARAPKLEWWSPNATAPGGVPAPHSVTSQLDALLRNDPSGLPVKGAAQLIRERSDGHPVLVLMASEGTTDALMQAGVDNALPIATPFEDTLVLDRSLPKVNRAVEHLPIGTLIIVEPNSMVTLEELALDRVVSLYETKRVSLETDKYGLNKYGLEVLRISKRRDMPKNPVVRHLKLSEFKGQGIRPDTSRKPGWMIATMDPQLSSPGGLNVCLGPLTHMTLKMIVPKETPADSGFLQVFAGVDLQPFLQTWTSYVGLIPDGKVHTYSFGMGTLAAHGHILNAVRIDPLPGNPNGVESRVWVSSVDILLEGAGCKPLVQPTPAA